MSLPCSPKIKARNRLLALREGDVGFPKAYTGYSMILHSTIQNLAVRHVPGQLGMESPPLGMSYPRSDTANLAALTARRFLAP
jgi:hypothetical protein